MVCGINLRNHCARPSSSKLLAIEALVRGHYVIACNTTLFYIYSSFQMDALANFHRHVVLILSACLSIVDGDNLMSLIGYQTRTVIVRLLRNGTGGHSAAMFHGASMESLRRQALQQGAPSLTCVRYNYDNGRASHCKQRQPSTIQHYSGWRRDTNLDRGPSSPSRQHENGDGALEKKN